MPAFLKAPEYWSSVKSFSSVSYLTTEQQSDFSDCRMAVGRFLEIEDHVRFSHTAEHRNVCKTNRKKNHQGFQMDSKTKEMQFTTLSNHGEQKSISGCTRCQQSAYFMALSGFEFESPNSAIVNGAKLAELCGWYSCPFLFI